MKFILSGGHSGIGLELSKKLLREGHQLGLILRHEGRQAAAVEALGTTEGVDFFYADLSKRSELAKVAEEIQGKWDRVDGLFNNAGLLAEKATYSEQGNEMQFEVNALTPYFLAQALRPLLDRAERAFVVNTATSGLHRQKALDVAELKRPKKFVKLMGSYLNSKFALVLLMNHLAAEWPEVRVVNVDPGPNKTKMTSGSGMPFWLVPIRNLFFAKPTAGAGKIYDAAFQPAFQDQTGIYITGGQVKAIKVRLSEAELVAMLR
ncbi:MAG: SDR family NAD(P)-dependent oxidoreductase [Bacteroidota bacterium]